MRLRQPRTESAKLQSMDDYRVLLESMLLMYGRLEQGHFRKKYRPVAHLAHGWFMRCSRGAAALLALHDAGFDGEAPPLQRSVVEHLIGMRWLLAQGSQVSAPLKTSHRSETERLLKALRSTTEAQRVDEKHFESVLASAQHDDHGRDNFQQFAHRAAAHGHVDDVLAYQGLVMQSHATYQSAVVYWDPGTKESLDKSRSEGNGVKFAATYLYRALIAYSAIYIAPPWREELKRVRDGLVELDPELDSLLEEFGRS